MEKLLKSLLLAFFTITFAMGTSSCSKDDDDESSSLVGKWEYNEVYTDDDETASLNMILTFKSDNTGSIVETWGYESRANSTEVYSMNFSWATSTDSSGNDILKVSYVSGDHDTEVFYGSSSTVLWTRQYVLTGKILNIYSSSSNVWVFNKK